VILLLKIVVRLVGLLLVVVLAAVGLALAVFSIQGSRSGLSATHLAHLVHLPQLRHQTDRFLTRVQTDGPVALVALAGGVGAVLFGLLLVVGVLFPGKERLVSMQGSGDRTLFARRRPLATVAGILAQRAEEVTQARVRVRAHRRGGRGTLTVRAAHTRLTDDHAARTAIERALDPLIGPPHLKTNVKARLAESRARVK
jgi:hypothetical protein